MNKQQEALKLALEALESDPLDMVLNPDGHMGFRKDQAITAIREALADSALERMAENAREIGLDYGPIVERVEDSIGMGNGAWDMVEPKELAKAFHEALAEQPAQQQKEGFASPGGGYVPAIPRPMPLDWKLVPRKATPEMLKAMDECAQEGYDERLYAGMASSVYMAAWDASPVMGTLPEQPAQQEPVAWITQGGKGWLRWHNKNDDHLNKTSVPLYKHPKRKPLSDAEIALISAECSLRTPSDIYFARAIEAAHGIKE